MGFIKSLNEGKFAEDFVANIFMKLGQIEYSNQKEYDIKVLTNPPLTIEVKHDKFANKSGNIAIEYHNNKKDKPSGINVSTADFWIYFLNTQECYLISLSALQNICRKPPLRIVEGAGDGNACLYLYKKDSIINDMINIVNLSSEGLKIVCGLNQK